MKEPTIREARLDSNSAGESPVVYSLTVEPLPISEPYVTNDPPLITTDPVTAANENVPYRYDADATDPDEGDILTFSLDSAPAGMTVDPQTGLVQWTLANAQVGDSSVELRVTDLGGLFDTQSFVVTLWRLPACRWASFPRHLPITSTAGSPLSRGVIPPISPAT